MINEVYLIWYSYIDDNILIIGKLSKINNKYIFKFFNDALIAEKNGCMLPFNYSKDNLFFDNMPVFFEQRMLKGKFNEEKFGINYKTNNDLSVLLFKNSEKNSDNFRIISEEKYKTIKK